MYVAHYLYVSPEGTFNPVKEDQTIESKVLITRKLIEAVNFIRENFDGLETFNEMEDDIVEAFIDGEKEYHCDDHSAGQWFRISRVGEDSVESNL